MSEFLDSPDLSSNHSVFVFNLGVHFSIWLNFTTYKDLIDSVIRMIRSKFADEHNNKPIVIWKTTTSIEKEKTHPKNLTHWRFHTHQVCLPSTTHYSRNPRIRTSRGFKNLLG